MVNITSRQMMIDGRVFQPHDNEVSMKMTMKQGLKTAAVAGAFTLFSGMAFADSHNENAVNPENGTDSANDPADVQPETQQHGTVDPNEPVVSKQENTMSDNDPSSEMSPDGMLPEDDGLDEDHGVDSNNVPQDDMNEDDM
ncbi:MAG: hypothetical protein ACTHXI_07835 [Halomonadaceae bacterium]